MIQLNLDVYLEGLPVIYFVNVPNNLGRYPLQERVKKEEVVLKHLLENPGCSSYKLRNQIYDKKGIKLSFQESWNILQRLHNVGYVNYDSVQRKTRVYRYARLSNRGIWYFIAPLLDIRRDEFPLDARIELRGYFDWIKRNYPNFLNENFNFFSSELLALFYPLLHLTVNNEHAPQYSLILARMMKEILEYAEKTSEDSIKIRIFNENIELRKESIRPILCRYLEN